MTGTRITCIINNNCIIGRCELHGLTGNADEACLEKDAGTVSGEGNAGCDLVNVLSMPCLPLSVSGVDGKRLRLVMCLPLPWD